MKFLIVGLLVSWQVFAGEVVFLKDYAQKRKSCSQWLSPNQAHSAKVLPFESRNPDYADPKSFLHEMAAPAESIFFLYSTGAPDFSRSSRTPWHVLPQIPSGEREIYLLKISGFDGSFGEKFDAKKTWKISEIREGARMISFTKVRVHPLFGAVQLLIEQVRGLECYYKNIAYQTPLLLSEAMVSTGPDKVKIERFLNSWMPLSVSEEALKEAAKGFFFNEFERYEERKSVEAFLTSMEKELLRFYTPEQVDSLLSTVRERSL